MTPGTRTILAHRLRRAITPSLVIVACLLTVLFVRSFWMANSAQRVTFFDTSRLDMLSLQSIAGRIRWVKGSQLSLLPPSPNTTSFGSLLSGPPHWERFHWPITAAERRGWYLPTYRHTTRSTKEWTQSGIVIDLPLWPIVAALWCLTALRLRRATIHGQRIREGHCLTCGYDLRASAGQCPECGSPIPSSPTALTRHPSPSRVPPNAQHRADNPTTTSQSSDRITPV